MLSVEIRYLNITWESPTVALKVEVSADTLELEQSDAGWQVQTSTFPQINHCIGIRITADQTIHTPYFQLDAGRKEELISVKVPGGKDVWWIQNSGWDEQYKRYLSELYRTAGRAELIVQRQLITLENNTFNFTVEELEHYLADFKNNLWMLILDNNSAAKAGVPREVPNYLDPEVTKLFHDFAQKSVSVINKPSMVLSEIQGTKPLRSVRPVPRTFREYAIKPHAKELTSRAYIESYDTAENRYIHYCVDRVRYLLKALKNTANAQANVCSQRIQQEKKWLESNQDVEFKCVDPRVLDSEILKLENDLKALNDNLSDFVAEQYIGNIHEYQTEFGTQQFLLNGNYANREGSFFGRRWNGSDFRQDDNAYLVVTLPGNSNLTDKELRRTEMSVTGSYYWRRHSPSPDKRPYYEITFTNVASVTVVHHPYIDEIQRLKTRREQLAANHWMTPLTADERQERVTERNIASKKIDFLAQLQQQSAEFFSKIPSLEEPLIRVTKFFKDHKVQKRSTCPNSMIFIQNPSYAAVKSLFKKISASNGMDESMLNALMAIDNMGLVNISNLYEKWCLLQIIKVLNQTYRFDLASGWQQALVSAILQKKYDIELRFDDPDRQQQIVLTYEKVLDSGKRPDFVIDLISKNYVQDDNTKQWLWNNEKSSRLVIDAKFRGDISEYQLQAIITELYEHKNYREDGKNSVYILHPVPNIINQRTSPLDWGKECDYGQTNNHKHGAIFLSPTLTHAQTQQNLQRLIGLFLQRNTAILQNENITAWHNICCISCGNTDHGKLSISYNTTKGGRDRWVIECDSCKLRTIKTVCYSCQTDLYKNGLRWTYHRTRAEQISNVVCPSCEQFL